MYLSLLMLLSLNTQQKIKVNIQSSASLALRPPQYRVLAAEWKMAGTDGKSEPERAKGHSRERPRTGSWRTATRRSMVPSVGSSVLKQWRCEVEKGHKKQVRGIVPWDMGVMAGGRPHSGADGGANGGPVAKTQTVRGQQIRIYFCSSWG